uniref:Uncharacterized protein n=1 Tax=Phytophthora ramorum TaxID=164328 RepID=H3HAC2_PHYRM
MQNSPEQQAWMDAAEAGDVHALQSLLAADASLLNTRLPHQWRLTTCLSLQKTFKESTALHLAVWRGHRAAVEFLIDHGAEIEMQDQTGMTALQIDVMRVCLQKMRPTLLLRSRCIDAQSPVAMAIATRRQVRDRSTYRDIDTSVLDLLLDHNACVDQPNEVSYWLKASPVPSTSYGSNLWLWMLMSQSGDTALLNAAEYGLTKHVEKLLAHGADANAQDSNGRSAMDIAGEHGFVDIVNVLVENCPGLVNTVGVESSFSFPRRILWGSCGGEQWKSP